jgi:hypothetical protein
MKMQMTKHRRASHVAARIYLVFCAFSGIEQMQKGQKPFILR